MNTELAWAAGFFDGEGTISRNKRANQLVLYVGQVRKEPLERFLSAVGLGKIYGPYDYSKRRGPNAKPYYTWQVGSFEHVQAVAAKMWRFLSEPKKEDIKRLLTEAKSYRHYKRRGA